jgi:hypothetical protein
MNSEFDLDTDDRGLPADDEIVAEVRAVREALAAEFGFDLQRLYEQLKTLEAAERARGRVIISPPRSDAPESAA